MDVIDHISARVSVATAFGAVAGAARAIHRGHPLPRTAGMTALSFALSSAACFSSERIVACALDPQLLVSSSNSSSNDNKSFSLRPPPSWEATLASHAAGGFLGGSILGFLYLGRPLRGAVFFVPVMIFVGTGDKLFQDVRHEHQERMIQQQQRQQPNGNGDDE